MWNVPQPRDACASVWANPRSLAATDGITFVFSSSGYLDVSVPPVCLSRTYGFSSECAPFPARGFPHSDIRGSTPAYGSPRLFVVRHVLLRLLAPRHPPCALRSLSYVNPHDAMHHADSTYVNNHDAMHHADSISLALTAVILAHFFTTRQQHDVSVHDVEHRADSISPVGFALVFAHCCHVRTPVSWWSCFVLASIRFAIRFSRCMGVQSDSVERTSPLSA